MSESLKKSRGEAGLSNAAHKPFRGNGGTVNPPYMREIYAYCGLKKISPFIPNGQTGPAGKPIIPKPGYYGRGHHN